MKGKVYLVGAGPGDPSWPCIANASRSRCGAPRCACFLSNSGTHTQQRNGCKCRETMWEKSYLRFRSLTGIWRGGLCSSVHIVLPAFPNQTGG